MSGEEIEGGDIEGLTGAEGDDGSQAFRINEEPAAVVEAAWVKRIETLDTWGTKSFDANLNPLPCASQDAALVICLVRQPGEGDWRAKLELRTDLAFSEAGASGRGAKELVALIEAIQRQFGEAKGVSFAEAGARKPHVFAWNPRRLVRAYGAGNVIDLTEEASTVLLACHYLADVLQNILKAGPPARLTELRWVVEETIATHDMGYLFARPGAPDPSDRRPQLTDELLDQVACGIGCRSLEDVRYRQPDDLLEMTGRPPREVVVIASQIVGRRRGKSDDYIRWKVIEPMLAGELNGVALALTEEQAKVRRAAEGQAPEGPEN
jgi:hypothetical protein